MSRCFSMMGIRLWIFFVVFWVSKLKGFSEAKVFFRMRMAFRWAFFMVWGGGERFERFFFSFGVSVF